MTKDLEKAKQNLPANKPTEEEINRLRALTGEQNVVTSTGGVPFMNFDGQPGKETSGKFFLPTGGQNEDGTREMSETGSTVQGVIVRIRKRLETPMNAKNHHRTPEFDDDNGVIQLLEDGEVILEGTKEELQSHSPELKLKNVIYFYLNEKKAVYRLLVPGGSLMNLWDYLKEFSKENDTTLRWVTEIGGNKIKNKTGFEYFQMTFKRLEEAENWKEIAEELSKLEEIIRKTAEEKEEEGKIKF